MSWLIDSRLVGLVISMEWAWSGFAWVVAGLPVCLGGGWSIALVWSRRERDKREGKKR